MKLKLVIIIYKNFIYPNTCKILSAQHVALATFQVLSGHVQLAAATPNGTIRQNCSALPWFPYVGGEARVPEAEPKTPPSTSVSPRGLSTRLRMSESDWLCHVPAGSPGLTHTSELGPFLNHKMG